MAQIRKTFQENFVKAKPQKNASYLGFIAQLPCCITGREGVQVCHISYDAPEYGHFGRAKSHKASDRWTIPMTPEAHNEQHAGNERDFYLRHGLDPHFLALVLYGLYSEFGEDGLGMARKIILERKST